jgi:vacuolar-type H+-ATPase subunit I/STV1
MMNRLLGFASLGVSSVALVVALWGSRGETVEPTPPPTVPAALSSAELEELEQRVESLEQTALSLSKRLMLLEQRPMASSDGGVAVAPVTLAAEVEQLKTEVRSMIAGEALNSQGGRDYLKDMVRSVQEEMRTEQRELRQQQMLQAQAQAQAGRAERLRQFVSDARLNYTQEQALTNRMQQEDAQRQALFDAVRAGSKSPRDARQELRAAREQTDKEMASVLDEAQRVKYEEMRREEWRESRPRGWGQGGDGDQRSGGLRNP